MKAMLLCCTCLLLYLVVPAQANMDLNVLKETHSLQGTIDGAEVFNITRHKALSKTAENESGTASAKAGNMSLTVMGNSTDGGSAGGTASSTYLFTPNSRRLQFQTTATGMGPYSTTFTLVDKKTGQELLTGNGHVLLNRNTKYEMTISLQSAAKSSNTTMSVDVSPLPVPEPATPALIGLISYFVMRKRLS